jgi:hypothetical protein
MKNGSIISRIWHGKTRAENADQYLVYVRKNLRATFMFGLPKKYRE